MILVKCSGKYFFYFYLFFLYFTELTFWQLATSSISLLCSQNICFYSKWFAVATALMSAFVSLSFFGGAGGGVCSTRLHRVRFWFIKIRDTDATFWPGDYEIRLQWIRHHAGFPWRAQRDTRALTAVQRVPFSLSERPKAPQLSHIHLVCC